MANKTIYVKDEKVELYDKAVQYSGEKSLSSLIEKVVEETVKKNEENLRDAIMMEAAERSGGAMGNIGVVIDYAKRAISKEIIDKAEYILDIFEAKDFFKDGEWIGAKGKPESESVALNNYFWYETLVEDDSSALDEMYKIATGPEFKEMEQEVISSEKRAGMLIEVVKQLILKKVSDAFGKKFLEELSKLDENEQAEYILKKGVELDVFSNFKNLIDAEKRQKKDE